MRRRHDPARAAAVGIAAGAALLVGGGLLLELAGALDGDGWIALVLVLAAGALLALCSSAWRGLPVLMATAALGLAVGAVALSREGAVDLEQETRFTQLWIVPDGPGRSAEVGLRNEERATTAFRVRVYAPVSRAGPPLVDQEVRLESGRTWSRRIAIPPTPLPERVNVEIFRAGAAEAYRSGHVWTTPGGVPR